MKPPVDGFGTKVRCVKRGADGPHYQVRGASALRFAWILTERRLKQG